MSPLEFEKVSVLIDGPMQLFLIAGGVFVLLDGLLGVRDVGVAVERRVVGAGVRVEVEAVRDLRVGDEFGVVDLGLPLAQEEWVDIAVVLDEGVLDLVVEVLLRLELLLVEVAQDIVRRSQQVHRAHAQAQDRQPRSPALPQLLVEEDLSRAAQHQRDFDQLHAVHREDRVHVGVDAGAAQHDHLVDPVEEAEADEHEDGAAGDEGGVEVGEPDGLDGLGVFLADAVLGVLHEVVGLLLGDVLAAVVPAALEQVIDLPGVHHPDERDEEGVEEEHDRLLLYHPVLLAVDVFERNALHQQRHDRSREEQPQRVLQPERELVLPARPVHLHVREEVQDEREDELVEEGDRHHRQQRPGEDRAVETAHHIGVLRVLHLVDRVLHCSALRVQDRVENPRDNADRRQGHRPPQEQAQQTAFVAVVDVLPNDLAGLRRNGHLDGDALHAEVVDELVLVDLVEGLQQLVADLLAVEHDDRLLADHLVLGDEPHLLLVLQLQLLLLLLQLPVDLGDLPPVLLGVRQELALLGQQPPLLVADELVVLEDVEQHQVLSLEVLAREGLLEEPLELALGLDLAGDVVEDDCVVGEEGGALVVVVARLVDGVAHVHESQQVHQEGAGAQDDLGVAHLLLRPHEADQPARTDAVVAARQVPRLAQVAEVVVGLVGPEERERGVAGDLEEEQDDVVLVEDEVEREAEAQEVQLLRVLAQRDLLLVDDVQTAAAELAALQLALPQLVRERQSRGARLPVQLRQLPVGVQPVHVVHPGKLLLCSNPSHSAFCPQTAQYRRSPPGEQPAHAHYRPDHADAAGFQKSKLFFRHSILTSPIAQYTVHPIFRIFDALRPSAPQQSKSSVSLHHLSSCQGRISWE